jgi:hypothetical protein
MTEAIERGIRFGNLVKKKSKPRSVVEMEKWLGHVMKHVEKKEKEESKIPDEVEPHVNEVFTAEVFSKLLGMGLQAKQIIKGEKKMEDLPKVQQEMVQDQLRPLAEFITGIQAEQLQREMEAGTSAEDMADRLMESDEHADERALAAMGALETMPGGGHGAEVPEVEPEKFAEEYRENINKKSSLSKSLTKNLMKGFISNVLASLIFAV